MVHVLVARLFTSKEAVVVDGKSLAAKEFVENLLVNWMNETQSTSMFENITTILRCSLFIFIYFSPIDRLINSIGILFWIKHLFGIELG